MRRAKVLIAQEKTNWEISSPEMAVEEVSKLSAVKEVLAEDQPNVAVIPLDLRGLNGADGLGELREISPKTKFIAVTRSQSQAEEVDVLRHGAKGYMTRARADSTLTKAIEKVHEGEIWAGRKAIGALLEEIFDATAPRTADEPQPQLAAIAPPVTVDEDLQRLTPRETEIVQLLHKGASNKEIASALNVTVSTVKAHLTNIFRKLNQPDRLRLALSISEHMRGDKDASGADVVSLPLREPD